MKVLLLADADSAHTLKWVEGLSDAGVQLAIFSLRPVQSQLYKERNFVLKNYSHERTIQLQKELYQSLID